MLRRCAAKRVHEIGMLRRPRERGAVEGLALHQLEHHAGREDGDAGLERKPLQDLGPDRRRAGAAAYHEGADGADVDHVQVFQRSHQLRGPEHVPPAHVRRPQEYDVRHGGAS